MNRLLGSLLLALLLAAGCGRQRPDPNSAVRVAGALTRSSFDPVKADGKVMPPGSIKFEQAELAPVLKLYAEVSGRSIIRAGNLPEIKITFSNQTPMTQVETLQALDTVLAAQGITMVFLGTQYVKAVPAKEAHMEPAPVIELTREQLPDSSSYLIYIVKLKNVSARDAAPALQPFSKMPVSIVALGSGGSARSAGKGNIATLPSTLFGEKDQILILRDYSSNVRRMLQVLEELEQR